MARAWSSTATASPKRSMQTKKNMGWTAWRRMPHNPERQRSASPTTFAPSPMVRACATTPAWYLSASAANNLSQAGPVLFQNAAVHHHKDSSFARFFRRFFVDYFLLHPHRRDFELYRLINNFFDKLGS